MQNQKSSGNKNLLSHFLIFAFTFWLAKFDFDITTISPHSVDANGNLFKCSLADFMEMQMNSKV